MNTPSEAPLTPKQIAYLAARDKQWEITLALRAPLDKLLAPAGTLRDHAEELLKTSTPDTGVELQEVLAATWKFTLAMGSRVLRPLADVYNLQAAVLCTTGEFTEASKAVVARAALSGQASTSVNQTPLAPFLSATAQSSSVEGARVDVEAFIQQLSAVDIEDEPASVEFKAVIIAMSELLDDPVRQLYKALDASAAGDPARAKELARSASGQLPYCLWETIGSITSRYSGIAELYSKSGNIAEALRIAGVVSQISLDQRHAQALQFDAATAKVFERLGLVATIGCGSSKSVAAKTGAITSGPALDALRVQLRDLLEAPTDNAYKKLRSARFLAWRGELEEGRRTLLDVDDDLLDLRGHVFLRLVGVFGLVAHTQRLAGEAEEASSTEASSRNRWLGHAARQPKKQSARSVARTTSQVKYLASIASQASCASWPVTLPMVLNWLATAPWAAATRLGVASESALEESTTVFVNQLVVGINRGLAGDRETALQHATQVDAALDDLCIAIAWPIAHTYTDYAEQRWDADDVNGAVHCTETAYGLVPYKTFRYVADDMLYRAQDYDERVAQSAQQAPLR